MLSIVRFILIVGVIFYYSPVRQKGEGTSFLDSLFGRGKGEPATASAAPPAPPPATEGSGHLETLWQALPNTAKQAVVDKILTTSGLSPAETKAADTLKPEDRHPAWQGPGAKPKT